MAASQTKPAGVAQYELEIEISAAPQRVWTALIDDINAWWLPDFRLTGRGSTVTLDARAGGHLAEVHADGSELLWSTVQMVSPAAHKIYLVGQLAPDWGGPSTYSLKLAVEERGSGSVLKILDAHHGNIDEKNLAALEAGWTQLFTDGLKAYVEGTTAGA